MVQWLLPPTIKAAYDIFMKNQAAYESDYSRLVFDIEKKRIDATNGRVALDVSMQDYKNGQEVDITQFIGEIDSKGEQKEITENVHIPYKYAILLDSILYIKVIMKHDKHTGIDIPHLLQVETFGGLKIYIDEFKYGGKNTLTLQKPKIETDLFGKSFTPKFVVAKHKEVFDKVLKKLNKLVPYSMTEEVTCAIGDVEEEPEYNFYLATKTPIQTM